MPHKITTDKPFKHKTKTGFDTYPAGALTVSDDVLKSAKKAKALIGNEKPLPDSTAKQAAEKIKALETELADTKEALEKAGTPDQTAIDEAVSKAQADWEAKLAATGENLRAVKSEYEDKLTAAGDELTRTKADLDNAIETANAAAGENAALKATLEERDAQIATLTAPTDG